jgi:hypothetical protein
VLAFAALAAAGCSKENPNFCDGLGCDAREIDAPFACSASMPCEQTSAAPFCVEGTCVGCMSATDCATLGDDRVLCLKTPPATRGECVACDELDEQAPDVGSATDECQTVGMQVCDGTSHTCRACTADPECTSGICDSGTCVDAGNIAYVATDGTSTTLCTAAMKCSTLQQGVDTGRAFVLAGPGTYAAATTLDINNRNVTIRAAGATFGQTGANREVVHVHGSSQAVIEGGTFDGTGDGNNAVIIHDGGASTLTLDGVTVQGSAGPGVVTTSRLTVRRSTITTNTGIGITVDALTQNFEMTGSTIIHNNGGGVRVNSLTATIMNNFFIKNCSANSCIPLNLPALTNPTSSRIEFNTIAGNIADNSSSAGSASCGSPTTVLRNSIFFSNNGNAMQVVSCTVRFSILQGATPDIPNGIITDAPSFISTIGDNFHLMPASAGTGKADPNAVLTGPGAVDFDGQSRPQPAATAADLGADEIP